MKECETYQTALDRQMQGAVLTVPNEALDDHLAGCTECTAYQEWAALIDNALDSDASPAEVDWPRLERALRWRAWRPHRRLGWTLLLIVASIAVGIAGEPQTLLVALGLSLAVLPRRVSEVLGPRDPSSEETGADIVAIYLQELQERRVRRFGSFLFYGVMATLMGAIAPFSAKPGVTLSLVALLAVTALVHGFRLVRMSSPDVEAGK